MEEIIKSVGIDIGTSTTQLIFSKLTVRNLASSYTVPRIEIVNKEVIYRSDIYFTPLIGEAQIDAERVKGIVADEYKKAGMKPEDLKTGAVIITGETARKENADEVLSALSHMAGDFVVATAGPDLESVLSARGAGIDVMSTEDRNTIANIDIGGGTSNIAVFQKGQLIGTSCLDIGGRLIKIEAGSVVYVYEKIQRLAAAHGISVKVGDRADKEKLEKICHIMARQLAMAVGIIPKDEHHQYLYTNDGRPLKDNIRIDGLTFSGGVADIIYHPAGGDSFRYGDIGPILGSAVAAEQDLAKVKRYEAVETIRATVVGAGTHTTEVSGSTIRYEEDALPIKNVPVVKVTKENEESLEALSHTLRDKIAIFNDSSSAIPVAISISGEKYTSFDKVQQLASALIEGMRDNMDSKVPVIVVVESDIGKVLGNALKVMLMDRGIKVICIDSIFVKDGDYIDIGKPMANGRVVPVVTKTLIFNT